uniref:GrpE protein homolog n=1 Tax=Paulinella longichromatophora TaxID=1708747 RepID=A0A2H4ZPD4_9EUKA|nr:Heat shock protein GrpE [Paulinella longichromatophora]
MSMNSDTQDDNVNVSEVPNKPIDISDQSMESINTEFSVDGANGENETISSSNLTLEDLQAAYTALLQEKESLQQQYIRIAADFDNFRKRQTRDQEDLRLQLTCSTLESILPVVDNFERARQQLDPQTEEGQELHRSYQGLYKQLVDVFKQIGVSPMRVEGELFDPNLHEAVLREPSDICSEDTITEELQRGYQLNGKVLRHALVKVSMGPGPKIENDELSSEISTDEINQSIS